MKKIFLLTCCQFCLLPGANAFRDVVTLKDGHQVPGLVETGDKGRLRIKVGDDHRDIALDQIQSIQFGPPADSAATVGQNCLTIPSATEIAIRTIDTIDSKKVKVGTEFTVSLDDPIVAGADTVAPANSNAYVQVAAVQNSRLKRASLSIVLVAVVINGQRVEVQTDAVDSQSGSRAKRTLTGTAIGAGTGAAIGAIAGGAVGAGIGAGVGAVAGTVGGILSGKSLEIAPEIRFTYKLKDAVAIHALVPRKGPALTGSWAGVDAWAVTFRVNGQDKTYQRAEVSQVAFAPPAALAGATSEAVTAQPPPNKYDPITPPPAPNAAPPKLEIGQTVDQVMAQLGQPVNIADLGARKIYLFKEWKVTFIDGKVSDIDVR